MRRWTETRVRLARPGEEDALTALSLRSKAFWGYDESFLEACRPELTLRAADIEAGRVGVVDGREGAPVGVAEVFREGDQALLNKLFVDPDVMRRGVGRELFIWACLKAQEMGLDEMVIDADPDAVPFYRRMGAQFHGSAPSGSIPGRKLPRLLVGTRPDNGRSLREDR